MAKMDKAEAGMGMKIREQATTKMLKSYRMWSLANMKDPKGNEVSIAEATKICEKKIKECEKLKDKGLMTEEELLAITRKLRGLDKFF